MKRTLIAGLILTIVVVEMCVARTASAQLAVPPRGPAAIAPAKAAEWNEAEVVFTGKLDRADAGPVARSMPPIYTNTLHFTVEKVLRGALKPGSKIACPHSARQVDPPTFPLEETCIVAASTARGQLVALRVEKSDKERLADITAACSLPLGWRMEAGKPVSPWAALGKKAWGGDAAGAVIVCSKSGRPALMAGPGVSLQVEHVPPAKDIQWTNPDGDGEYKITVTNTTDKPVTVPALLTDGKNIVWENSLVVLCQRKPYVCPGFRENAGKLQPAVLKPGESVSGVVNALRLDGPEWPRGGYRIEFQFCLGEKSQTKSFYYMSRHHDPIRDGLNGK